MDRRGEPERHLAALMRAAQDGDGKAYSTLLKEITPLLRNAVRRRVPLQPQDVEDLVQDILLSLHAVRATYDPERPFLPWLFGIVRNRLAEGARRHARRVAREVVLQEGPETFPDSVTNLAETYRDPEALRRAILALPPGQRDAVEMLKLRELSLKEAASLSGMSIAALKVAVHRAIRSLRRALATGP